jgi:hypothetical protein
MTTGGAGCGAACVASASSASSSLLSVRSTCMEIGCRTFGAGFEPVSAHEQSKRVRVRVTSFDHVVRAIMSCD